MHAKDGSADIAAHETELMSLSLGGLFAAMVSTQVGASLAKALFPVIGVMGAVAGRILFAALFMTLVLGPWKTRLTMRNVKPILLYGIALAFMNLCFYQALSRIPLGIAVTIEFIGPLGIAMVASRKAMDFLWAFFAIAGLALLAPWDPKSGHALDPVGVVYAVGAGIGWGSYIITSQMVGQSHGPRASALGMIIATIIVLPFGFTHLNDPAVPLSVIPLLAAVALFSSALPYTLEMFALRRIPTKTFGTLMSLEPAVAALIGYLWLGEALAFRHWIAVIAIMVASAGATWTISRTRAAPEPYP